MEVFTKYKGLIKQIEGIFDGLTQEEQIELITLSPILHAIYSLGVNDGIEYRNSLNKW